MPESPRKSVNIVDSSKKENVEVSASVDIVEPDRKDDSPLHANNLNLQSSSMLETSNIDNETPVTQPPENKFKSSAEISDTSKNETLKHFSSKIENKENFVVPTISPDKKPIIRLETEVLPSLPQSSSYEIANKECSSSVVAYLEKSSVGHDSDLASSITEITDEEFSLVSQELLTGTDPEVPLSSQSGSSFSGNANEVQLRTSSDAEDESSLAFLTTSPLMTSNKESSIQSSILELPLTVLHTEMSPSLTISSETANLDDSVQSTTISEKPPIEFSKQTDTLPLVSSEITNQESSILSPSSSDQSSTTPDNPVQFLPSTSSKSPNFIHDSNMESSIISPEFSEQLSELGKEIATISSSTLEITRQEVSVPLTNSLEQPIESEGIQNLPSNFSSEVANIVRFESTVPLKHSEIPISVPSASETNVESFTRSIIPSEQSSGQAEIPISVPTSEVISTEGSNPPNINSEQLKGQLETPISVPSPSEITNPQSSIRSDIHSEQAETSVSVPSTSKVTNQQFSNSLLTAISETVTSLSLPSTSRAVAGVSISEQQKEIVAEKLLGVVAKMTTVFKELKETETLLDRGYQRCHCNSKKLSKVAKSQECKCPGLYILHLYAQESRLTISVLFVQLQKIYNWFKLFENIDERFKDHMADIENLHQAVSDMLTRFNLGHW